ncbi:hypothetical protein GO301_05007 [Ralstonia solanacearum]|nr:hypothetical protein [Ralstonia solanacearum]
MSSRLSTVPAARARINSRLNSAVFSSTGWPRQVTVRLGGEMASSPNTSVSSRGAAGSAAGMADATRRSKARARATSRRGSTGLST